MDSESESASLLLFVLGNASASIAAIEAVVAVCRKYLAGHYSLQVVDVFRNPALATEHGIAATPTLLKLGPGMPKRAVGTLTKQQIMCCLDLEDLQ